MSCVSPGERQMTLGHSQPTESQTRIAGSMGKARILMEALPYIREFRGKVVVIKYGGSAMEDPELRHSFAGDVTLLAMVGLRPVIVHGGGKQISEVLAQRGILTKWVDGLRVSTPEVMEVVQRVLVGEVNPDIVRLLGSHGANALGVSGLDGRMFRARPLDPRLGRVGEIYQVDLAHVEQAMLHSNMVPVVAPIALGDDGQVYNCNADTAAGILSKTLRSQKLVYLTDVEGVYREPTHPASLITRMSLPELNSMLDSQEIQGGMLPKLQSVRHALEGGVRQAHILDGRTQHALLLEIFTAEGIGTMITADPPT